MRNMKLNARYYRLRGNAGYVEKVLDIDLDRTAFLPVDVYGAGYTEADGVIGRTEQMARAERMGTVGRIKDAIEAARSVKLPIIYVNNSAPKIDLAHSTFVNQRNRSYDFDWVKEMAEDNVDPKEYHYAKTSYVGISKMLAPRPDEYFIRKLYYSGFCDTWLDKLLRHLDVKTTVFVGYAADICLHCTMVDALNANYEVVFLRDAVLAHPDMEPELFTVVPGVDTERMNLWHELYCGYSTTTDEFVRACRSMG